MDETEKTTALPHCELKLDKTEACSLTADKFPSTALRKD
jgi:hypothetical protein